jgi:hypothetical protein
MHSAKPLERQVRYSFRNYTDKPSQRLQARREATSVTVRSPWNDKFVIPFGSIQTSRHSSDFRKCEKPLQSRREATGTTSPLFLSELYRQAITATSGTARPLKRQIRYSFRNYTDKPFQRNCLHFLAISATSLPVRTQQHYIHVGCSVVVSCEHQLSTECTESTGRLKQ